MKKGKFLRADTLEEAKAFYELAMAFKGAPVSIHFTTIGHREINKIEMGLQIQSCYGEEEEQEKAQTSKGEKENG
jgi:hypothetical protein